MSREVNMTVRITLTEREAIRATAQASGKDVSSLVRDLVAAEAERLSRLDIFASRPLMPRARRSR